MKNSSRKVRMPKPPRIIHPGAPALEWLSDVSGRAARATAIGSRRVLIENHTGVKDFSETTVRLSTAAGLLTVHGQDLTLNEVRPRAMIIRGRIRCLELPGGEE